MLSLHHLLVISLLTVGSGCIQVVLELQELLRNDRLVVHSLVMTEMLASTEVRWDVAKLSSGSIRSHAALSLGFQASTSLVLAGGIRLQAATPVVQETDT